MPKFLFNIPHLISVPCNILLRSVADPGSILDPIFFHPGSEFFPSRKNVSILKNFSFSCRTDPCGARIPGCATRLHSKGLHFYFEIPVVKFSIIVVKERICTQSYFFNNLSKFLYIFLSIFLNFFHKIQIFVQHFPGKLGSVFRFL